MDDRIIKNVDSLIYLIYNHLFFDKNNKRKIMKYFKRISSISFDYFYKQLLIIKDEMIKTKNFIYLNDKSIKSYEEIFLFHPGFYAVFSYRIAHFFYLNDEYILAKCISYLSHKSTGIDINPGASIGKKFFIDHGTGIVIGETSIIGDNVIMFHGVTLGTKNIKNNAKKRHPTIKDNVILYSNCTILGGDTIINEGCVIGCNVVVLKSVEKNTILKSNNTYG